jgi:hypothetical protein
MRSMKENRRIVSLTNTVSVSEYYQIDVKAMNGARTTVRQ